MKEYKKSDAGRDGNFDILRGSIERRIRFLTAIPGPEAEKVSSEQAGVIRATKVHGIYRYYLKKPGSGEKETYLTAKQIGIAKGIAQREYDEKAAEAAQKEICLLQKYLSFAEIGNVNQVYETLSEGRKLLVKPVYPTKEKCLEKWYEIPDHQLTEYAITGNNYTRRGEHVRSKSEVFIADALDAAGIPYRYEAGLTLPGGTVYSDFMLLDLKTRKVLYWEHLGMMGDSDYAKDAFKKIRRYREAGIFLGTRLIVTWETSKEPLGTLDVRRTIQEYFPDH